MTTPAKPKIHKPNCSRCLEMAEHAEHLIVIALFVNERFAVGIPAVLVAVIVAAFIRDERRK